MANKKLKLVFAVICIASLTVVTALIGLSFAAEPQRGGILKISRSSETRGLGYPPTVKQGDIYVGSPCVQTLLKLDDQSLPTPNLAESWEFDPATNTLTLRLRKGVKFHDMTDFNADAVKYNFTVIFAEQNALMLDVKEVVVADNHTVLLKLKKWSNAVLPNLCLKWGIMISPEAYKKNGKDWCNSHPVGTGPFKFVSWERDVMHKFEKFDHYWEKGKPYLDGIEWHIVVDPVTQLAAFSKGEHHIMADVDPKDARKLETSGKYKISKVLGEYHQISGDGVHPESPWANVKVRQAMMHAIDRKGIADAVGHGYWTATPRQQMALPGGWADNPDVKGYPYDPQKAKELLAAAGYPNGFKTRLLSINKPQYVVDFMTAVQGQLRAIGIDAALELMDAGREFKINVGGTWDNALMWAPNSPRGDLVINHNMYKPTAHFHKCTARPAEYQEVLEEAMAQPDFKTMQKLMLKSQELAIDKYAIVNVLFAVPYLAAKHPGVHDDGLMEIHATNWHPENAWLSK